MALKKKIKKRLESSFLFKPRFLGLSISDWVLMLAVAMMAIFAYRYLGAGWTEMFYHNKGSVW